MSDLAAKKCVPCEGGAAPLSPNEAQQFQTQLSAQWRIEHNKVIADFKFKNFKEAMKFVNHVADIAETEGHHPDIIIHYSKVRLEIFTHAIVGLSENDFILAAKIDTISTS